MTSIYRKKTFSGLYTKRDSFTPCKFKVNLIRILTYRCPRICCSPTLLQFALSDLRKLILQNGHLQEIIKYNIYDVLKENRNKLKSPVFTVPNKYLIILLPCLGLESNQICKRLKSRVSKFYPTVNLTVLSLNTSRMFFPYKDRLNRSQRSKVVYRASCWDCDDSYIGKTKRRVQDRETEKFKALGKQEHTSAIADHIKATGHNIQGDDFQILASGKTDYHCKVKETLSIQKLNPTTNVLI